MFEDFGIIPDLQHCLNFEKADFIYDIMYFLKKILIPIDDQISSVPKIDGIFNRKISVNLF